MLKCNENKQDQKYKDGSKKIKSGIAWADK